jgi:inorganic phosphate transporter, PiT family
MENELLLYFSVGLTLVFALINGFHDGGNVIATAVCSRSITPGKALLLAGTAEFLGPLVLGTAVASTVAESIFRQDLVARLTPDALCLLIIGGMAGAIVWNLVTWVVSLPSSSSHALIGGLIGAGVVTMGREAVAVENVVRDVVIPLLVSPLVGAIAGFIVFATIRAVFSGAHRAAGHVFETLQKPCVVFLAASHGSNDAQKSMGVIALLLAGGGGELRGELHLPTWVVVSCAAALALGLCLGGWRMVKTVGFRIARLDPVHSFSSELTATCIVGAASLLGGPVSTTQVVASSVMGVGAARRLGAVRWAAARNIAYAWFLTVPASAVTAAGLCRLLHVIYQL